MGVKSFSSYVVKNDNYVGFNNFLIATFLTMVIGLLVTATVSLIITRVPEFMGYFFKSSTIMQKSGALTTEYEISTIWYIFAALELVMVWVISKKGVTQFKTSSCAILFLTFAILNGITLVPILYEYPLKNVFSAFIVSVVLFLVFAVYGYKTKQDLSKLRSFLTVGLISLIIAMIINIILNSSLMSFVISGCAVIIFSGLISAEIQDLKYMYNNQYGRNKLSLAIYGALSLYLSFLNLFLHILRLKN